MDINELFKIIYESSKSGSFGLFVGSGFAKAVVGDGVKYFNPYTWDELLKKCCEKFEIDINTIPTSFTSSPAIASSICQKLKEKEGIDDKTAELKLKIAICQLTAYFPHEDHTKLFTPLLSSLDISWAITTNYDQLLDSLLENSYSIGPTSAMVAPKGFIPVYHIHGIRTEPDSIVINNNDYLLMSRPHEYRMDTLSMKLKESTTLMLGYSISDTNVLSAIDLANNVYQNKTELFQNKLIQFVYDGDVTDDYKIEELNGLKLIRVYGNSMVRFLTDYQVFKKELDKIIAAQDAKNSAFTQALMNLGNNELESFIDNPTYRRSVIDWFNLFGNKYLNIFIKFISKAFEICWERASEAGAFHRYKSIVELIIDLLCYIQPDYFHPMFFSLILSNFESVSSMIGYGFGESWASKEYWDAHKNKIPNETLKELYIISKQNLSFFYILLSKSFPNLENEVHI